MAQPKLDASDRSTETSEIAVVPQPRWTTVTTIAMHALLNAKTLIVIAFLALWQ